MEFFKAIEVPHRPFVRWAGWAKNIDELIAMGEADNPLILPAELVPDFVFEGYVCPVKIVDGELVDLTSEELDDHESAYDTRIVLATDAAKINDLGSGSFSYGGKSFPMHETARLRYLGIANDTPHVDTYFMTLSGVPAMVEGANISGFMTQYYKALQLYTNIIPPSEE